MESYMYILFSKSDISFILFLFLIKTHHTAPNVCDVGVRSDIELSRSRFPAKFGDGPCKQSAEGEARGILRRSGKKMKEIAKCVELWKEMAELKEILRDVGGQFRTG